MNLVFRKSGMMLVSFSAGAASAFVMSPFDNNNLPHATYDHHRITLTTTTNLLMSFNSNNNSEDPFVVLNMAEPTVDKGEIKRAYRRMAMQYHPDVVLSENSTAEDKREANERFAKINAAYEILTGKREASKSSSSSSRGRGSSSTGGYATPPHRRSRTATPNTGVDWTDFMPKDDNDYDAGGDSFGSIFSDFVSGIADSGSGSGSSSSTGGFLRDLVDFLEGNVEGFSSGNYNEDDPTIQELLRSGTLHEVKVETDDTDLLVRQLEKKLADLTADMDLAAAGTVSMTASFEDRMDNEERLEVIKARKRVVEGYLIKARGRLARLQSRYKDLRSKGRRDDSNGDNYNSASTKPPPSSTHTGGYNKTSSSSNSSSSSGTASSTKSPSTERPSSTNKDDAWKREGFGSSGRGRGRRRRTTTTATDGASTSSANPDTTTYRGPPSSPPRAPPSPRTREASDDLKTSMTEWATTPPHRRSSPQRNNVAENKKRLQELKVEDEFEKLKNDLGL